MFSYGDREPEDAWDAGDSLGEHVHNLAQRIALLDGMDRPSAGNPSAVLDSITQRIRASIAVGISNERQATRLIQLIEDVALTRSQL